MIGEELDMLFDIMDTDVKGYLTIKEIQLLDETTFFDALDVMQIEAALITVCGLGAKKCCFKSSFRGLLKELERRRSLEEKIRWDFNALDGDSNGRISLASALFLFKSVHVANFSINLWNKFLSSRIRPEEEVAFDELRMFLCNIPEDSTSDNENFRQYSSQAKQNQTDRDYVLHQSLIAWQEDETVLVTKEKEKQFRSANLKQSASHLMQRLDDIGMQALLEEDDGTREITERAYERVNATDLLNALKEKYDKIRDHLLFEMLKIQVGEGMMAALSLREQNERLFQVKVKEENLRKEGKHEEMSVQLPGSKCNYNFTLLWLMGESISEIMIKEEHIKEKMIESGMEHDEIAEEIEKKLCFEEKQQVTTDLVLLQLNKRLQLEKDMISNRLQGIGTYSTINAGEREHLFCLLFMMQLRALNEQSFETASLWVGLTERLVFNQSDIMLKDRKRHEQLAMKRLVIRKGQKTKNENNWFKPIVMKQKEVQGRIDIEIGIVQNMERRLLFEREIFINFLQGRDSMHYRINAKKLTSDERSNQLLVLKTQWQGWQHHSKEDKVQSLEQHRLLLQEAVSIVYEIKKEESRMLSPNTVDDLTIACSLLCDLQLSQEAECKSIMNFSDKNDKDLERLSIREIRGCEEEWLENIASVIFGIKDVSDEEEELIKALNEKYDAVRDKLLLDALKKQMSDAEWAKLSEQERQARLMKLKLMERRLRRDGKYDEAAALLGDAMKNADLLQSLFGESRQRYLDKIQERLKARKKRISEGEIDEDEDDDEPMDDDEGISTGNILKDLQMRFEEEKDALLRRLQEGEGRLLNEKERQAELIRLRIEKRKAEREGNFEGAALVLGIAERNSAAREEGLRKDRERQEKLAKERLEARRNAHRKKIKEVENPEPSKDDDISVWHDSVMRELEKKQLKERDFLFELLNDSDIGDLCDEAKNMTEEEQSQRISKLRDKRDELDFEDSSDQEEHGAILEMAAAVKVIIRGENIAKNSDQNPDDISVNDVAVSLMADLQEIQDKETTRMIQELKEKNQDELAVLRTKQIKSRNYEELSNVAEVIFSYEGKSSDKEIIKALDKKYDALMDKLILEGLKKQLGDAEFSAMTEKERQAEMIKRRLEQKRLLRDGKLEEAAKLLGEGFKTDASLKKLMGQSRARYQEMVNEKLARRRERHKLGIEADEDEDDDLDIDEFENEGESINAKTILTDLHERYEDEKEALMMKLKGADAKFYSERERQAELARLRREQRKVKLEEKFGSAAMLLGLAERNQATRESKMKSDRVRQEQLAKERLERMREKRKSKQKEMKLMTDGDDNALRETAMEHIEYRHSLEREALVHLFGKERPDEIKKANCMTFGNREEQLKEIKDVLLQEIYTIEDKKWDKILDEISALKEVNRLKVFESDGIIKKPSRNDVIISLIADLQEQQDKESDQNMEKLQKMERDEIIEVQTRELEVQKSSRWENVVMILAESEKTTNTNDDTLVDALHSKYEVLKDKLILDALERKIGVEEWSQLSEDDRFGKLMEIKLQMKNLLDQGKIEELNQMMAELLPEDVNMDSLLMLDSEQWAKRMEAKEQLRKERKESGMSEEEINELEKKEDFIFQEELKKKSPKNTLLHLEQNFEAEKDALLASLRGANAKLMSERERQAELARLKREQRKARKEDNFESAALVLSLAKTQQAAVESKLKSDRERQEKLAKERLLSRKNRRDQLNKTEHQPNEAIEDTDDIGVLQEGVLSEMEIKHIEERNFLLQIIQESPGSPWEAKAKELDIVSKQQRINELKVLRMQWRDSQPSQMLETLDSQIEGFKEAASLRIQMVLDEIAPQQGEKEDSILENASIKILADLQENQDREAQFLLTNLSQKTLMVLKQLHKVQHMARNEKWYDNIASGLLGIKRIHGGSTEVSEDAIVDALNSKYTELKEKLYVEILKTKFGEHEWEKMTKEEQQNHLQLLRSEEIKLKNGEEITDSILKEFKMSSIGVDQDKSNDQPMTSSDLLKDLQNQYEAEKDAILASLQGADAKFHGEKERQEALFKLRREKQKLKREDKFDSAAIIFNMAQQNEKMKDTSNESERSRQKELAMKRLAAIRKKKQAKSYNLDEVVLEEQQRDIIDDIRAADEIQREGTIAAKNIVLEEMERKHCSEREALIQLLSVAEGDEAAKDAANYLTKSQITEKIADLRKNREIWKQNSSQATANQPLDNEMTEDEKKENAARISRSWQEHQQILTKALVFKCEELKKSLITDGHSDKDLPQEVSVILLSDLQEKQSAESNAMNTVTTDKKQDFLLKVKQEQRKQRRENWMENLANLLLGGAAPARKQSSSKAPDMSDISEEMEGVEEMLEDKEREEFASLEQEMEKEKEKRNFQELTEEEMSRLMSELQQQQEAKKQAILASIEKQRADAKRRLEEKRRKRDEKQYEEDVALSIISTANERSNIMREKTILQKRSQQDSLEDRLRLRREERKRKAEIESQRLKDEDEAENKLKKEQEAKKIMQLPGGGLRREKTVVEEAADMDDSQKQEIVGVLMREQTTLALRLNREQTRQEEMVKFLRSKRRQKQEQREQEAATIVGIGERQKTIVASQTKSERERQIASVRDRVKRIKFERTMTMKEPKDEDAVGFETLLDDKETEGLTEDEKMAKVARKMELKLRQEGIQKEENVNTAQLSEDENLDGDEIIATSHGGKLDEKMQVQKLKDRYLQKKKSRKNKNEKD